MIVEFELTMHDAVVTTVGRLCAQVAYAAGRLAAPAAVVQACRAVTVFGAEQFTAVVKF